ncbi:MAG: NAD-dependent epimerase/dehydratase family protein [Planctomycetia bacterium]|nr:NAD-dependent epimerase/dehydratase family protein [Planctomycetia bacterium]
MSNRQLVTGATGLLGSHLAEQLIQAGHQVRALVRPGSETAFLRQIGVECSPGDLSDRESIHRAMQGVDTVYHAAAKVGDWGTRQEFEQYTITGTENVAQACMKAGIRRLVHVSSTSAYGHPSWDAAAIDESCPLGDQFWVWDDYTRAKVEAEKMLWKMFEEQKLPLTIVRPSWLYGPRDRLTVNRMYHSLRLRKARIIGAGNNRMNTVYAGSVAHCCVLAAASDQALGQAYNATCDGAVTQREWFDLWAEAFQLPKPTATVPYALAFRAALFLEALYRMSGSSKPPYITRYAVWLLGRPTFYVTGKAERELGWKPVVTYAEGVRRTVEWYQSQSK